MALTESEFQSQSDAALSRLNVAMGFVADQFDADVLFQSGVLTVQLEGSNPGKIVVSPNSPARQIWVSALLKSFKLDWDYHREAFVLPATGETLDELLGRIVGEQLGVSRIKLT
jgi:iron donor protein CyaY